VSDVGGARWQDLARKAARSGEAEHEELHAQRLLRFRLDDAAYAVPVERVREIVRLRPITAVPRAPDAVRGVVSLRGEILQVIDLRVRLGLPPREPGRAARIVVVHDGDGRVAGVLVDSVSEVLAVAEDAPRSPAPPETRAVEALYLHGGRFVSLIDLDRVLDVDAAS
jgi:purine-binding chemotaxis protein CheW